MSQNELLLYCFITLLECLRYKFKKERIPLVNASVVLQMRKEYGTKKRANILWGHYPRTGGMFPCNIPWGHYPRTGGMFTCNSSFFFIMSNSFIFVFYQFLTNWVCWNWQKGKFLHGVTLKTYSNSFMTCIVVNFSLQKERKSGQSVQYKCHCMMPFPQRRYLFLSFPHFNTVDLQIICGKSQRHTVAILWLSLILGRITKVTTDWSHLLCNVVLYSQVVLDLEIIGEDDTSYQDHINSINWEMGKKHPDRGPNKNHDEGDSFPTKRGNEQATD